MNPSRFQLLKPILTFCTALVFIFALLASVPAHRVFAQDWSGLGNGTALDAARNGEVNKEGGLKDTLDKLMINTGCSVLPVKGPDRCTENDLTYQQLQQQSAFGSVSHYIAGIFQTKPASTAVAFQDIGQSLGFLPHTAYAQGIGFTGLAPLLPLWKAFRNIAYLLLAIAMLIVAFMVMFRKKIDPKTVVTVQNAIPRIVVTLLLITFSYAIVGILVDLMYLILLLLVSIIVAASNGVLGADTAQKYMGGNIGTLWWSMFWGGLSSMDDVIRLISWENGYGIIGATSQIVNTVFASAIIFIILGVAILISYIRILFMLVSAYIQILLALIVGPLQLLADVFPGANSFGMWFNNLIANLAVFPITAAMLMLGTIITRLDPAFPAFQGGTKLWQPPFLAGGGNGSSGFAGLIGLGFLMTIPTVANSLKELLKARAAVDAGPGAMLGPMGSGLGQVFQLGYQASFVGSMFRHGPVPGSSPVGRALESQEGGLSGSLKKSVGGGSSNH